MCTADKKFCKCGSEKPYVDCCEPYYSMLDLNSDELEPLLIDWRLRYGFATCEGFHKRASTFSFRISIYLDSIINKYLPLGYLENRDDDTDETIISIKHNILLGLFGAYSCLSEGLFIQSGILLRSVVEDCFILVDIFLNPDQLRRVLDNKYSTSKLLSRIKNEIPAELIDYYGYFSANFSHFGAVHPAPYRPRACYEDNWVLVLGIENLIRAILTFHISLERIYFKQTRDPFFWEKDVHNNRLCFNGDNIVYDWVNKLIKELQKSFPPDERKNGFEYTEKSYKLKK